MKNVSRTKRATVNAVISLVSNFLQIIFGFVLRKLFISYLGITFLGYNSVFSNILQMLNLADLGIGVAVTSFLYKPLAEGDKKRIASLMFIYRKIYFAIGGVVICIGMVSSIFIGYLIPDAVCSIWYLRILFFINLIGTVSTYFVAYKRTLIIADQKSYIANITDTVMFFVITGLQVLSLVISPNYITYSALNILKNIISNIILSIKANKIYGDTEVDIDMDIVSQYQLQINQYIKDVFISKLGSVIYYSTDNIILSVMKGSMLTGYLSNYTLITTQLNTVIVQVLTSLQATFGNYIITTEDKVKQRKMTDNYFCVNFIIGNFCMTCFVLLAQPFVKMFFGENMLLGFSTVFWLGINLMLTFLLQLPSQVFTIYKLFKYDRLIIVISAFLNIFISIILVKRIGINGVLIGTFVSSLIYLFSRFYVICNHVYNINYRHYLNKFVRYGLISVLSFTVCYVTTSGFVSDGIFGFFIKALVVGCLSLLTTSAPLFFTEEFEFLLNRLIPEKFKRFVNKSSVLFITAVLILATFVTGILISDKTANLDAGNKSYSRTDSYMLEEMQEEEIFHLSFDDVIIIFKDLKDNKPESIMDNPTINWFKELHSKYGVVISCFVYCEDGEFDLSQVPGSYRKEFEENADWLRFGFHAINPDTNYKEGAIEADYIKTVKELKRIVGAQSIDNFLRLQMFQGSYEEIKKLTRLSDEPIVGLLTSDDNRSNYYLSEVENNFIYSHDQWFDSKLGIWFVSTDLRTEYVDSVNAKVKEFETDAWNNQKNNLVVFTHEWALNIENKKKIEELCKYAEEKGYKFKYFEDILNNPIK